MRTKALLGLAALAAGALTASAQSNVYSLNVVGYVNVPVKGGANFNFIANPLNNANNNITNLFANAQDGDQIYKWNSAAQDLDGTIYTYSSFAHAWDGDYVLAPGEGVFYMNAGNDASITFVGEVLQGNYTNPKALVGGAAFNAVASSAPIGGSFTNAIGGLYVNDGDQIYSWDTTTQDLSGSIATYSGFAHAWDTTGINIAPGVGFFYMNSGTNQTWVRNFTVQ